MTAWRSGCAVVLAGVFLGAAGCGGGPPYRISGKVTFDGKPVPLGRIYFDPDPGQQNTGPSGYTDVKNGEYDTARVGRGVSGGATVVRIQGFKKEGADASGFGPPLFPEYTVHAELPRGPSTNDFDVPATAAGGLPPMVPLDQGPGKSKGGT